MVCNAAEDNDNRNEAGAKSPRRQPPAQMSLPPDENLDASEGALPSQQKARPAARPLLVFCA